MSKLFQRVASVTIGGHKFSYPPFSFEFMLEFRRAGSSNCVVKLKNPSDETVEIAQPKRKKRAQLRIEAGYGGDLSPMFFGEIYDFSFKKSGNDRTLTVKATDAGRIWERALVNQSFKLMRVSSILLAMAGMIGVPIGKVQPASDNMIESFTAVRFRDAVADLAKRSGSRYYFNGGRLNVEAAKSSAMTNAIFLSAKTGLLSGPDKSGTGYEFQTLFLPEIQNGAYVTFEDGLILKIFEGKHTFKTHGKAGTKAKGVKV